MKITDVTVNRYGNMGGMADFALGREFLIVDVHTDEGISGRGFTGAPITKYGPTGDVYATLIRRNLRNMIVGENPLHTEELWNRMHRNSLGRRGLMGAIDLALWDLKGKIYGVPVCDLIGGRKNRIATYANAAHQLPADELAQRAAAYVNQGHTAVKIRGSASAVSLKEATARVHAVREAIGPDVKLMVDVNGTWDVDTAIQQLKLWERYDIYWLEEPVRPEDIPGYVRVRNRAGKVYIVGGETHPGVSEFRQLFQEGAVDIAQPDALTTGGITEWLRIATLARAFNVPVSPHALQIVHIHMAAALPNVMWVEYFMPDNHLSGFEHRLFKEPKMASERTDDGVFLRPPDTPGLGIELDEAEAEQSLISE